MENMTKQQQKFKHWLYPIFRRTISIYITGIEIMTINYTINDYCTEAPMIIWLQFELYIFKYTLFVVAAISLL